MTWDASTIEQIEKNKTVRALGLLSSRYNEVLPLPMQPIDRSMATFEPSRDTSLLRLVINVDDVNDEWPKFKRNKYITAVDVNLKAGSEVIKVNKLTLNETSRI